MASANEIPLNEIHVNPNQPRRDVAHANLEALATSIADHGVLQPILVTETLDGYRIVAGERRVQAARLAGLERIPAVIRQLADREQLELALVENVQREDLNPRLTIQGVLLTMYDARTNLSAEVRAEVRRHLGPAVYDTLIPRSVRLSEAPSHGLPIALYQADSKGARAYGAFSREFRARLWAVDPAATPDSKPAREPIPVMTSSGAGTPPDPTKAPATQPAGVQ